MNILVQGLSQHLYQFSYHPFARILRQTHQCFQFSSLLYALYIIMSLLFKTSRSIPEQQQPQKPPLPPLNLPRGPTRQNDLRIDPLAGKLFERKKKDIERKKVQEAQREKYKIRNLNSDEDMNELDGDQNGGINDSAERNIEQEEIGKISKSYSRSQAHREYLKFARSDQDFQSKLETHHYHATQAGERDSKQQEDGYFNPDFDETAPTSAVNSTSQIIAPPIQQVCDNLDDEITDYFLWNDREGLKKKTGEQLFYLDEVQAETVPEHILIDEYDQQVLILDSDSDEDDDVCIVDNSAEQQVSLKREMLLYNLKKEIQVAPTPQSKGGTFSKAWKTLSLKSDVKNEVRVKQEPDYYDYHSYLSGDKKQSEEILNPELVRQYLLNGQNEPTTTIIIDQEEQLQDPQSIEKEKKRQEAILLSMKQTKLSLFKIRVNKHTKLKRDQVEECFVKDLEIYRVTKNFNRTIKFMMANHMLLSSRPCPACARPMRILNNHAKVKDGLVFKCTRLECRDVRVSVREGTIFEDNKLTLMESMRVIFYYFSRGFNALQTYRDLKEFNIPGLQYSYVYELYKKVRQLIHEYYQNHYRKHKLGHFGRAVEIDESKFTHHTKGGQSCITWVLGFYERGTKDVRSFVMRGRDIAACTQLVRDNVIEGGEIYTDFWRGYLECKQFFIHRAVNKERHGYGQAEYQTTSRVEGLWSMLKRQIHTYSSIRNHTLQKYLDEGCWRIRYKTFKERNEFLSQLLNVKR